MPIKLKAYDELNHSSAAIFRIDLNESNVIQFIFINLCTINLEIFNIFKAS